VLIGWIATANAQGGSGVAQALDRRSTSLPFCRQPPPTELTHYAPLADESAARARAAGASTKQKHPARPSCRTFAAGATGKTTTQWPISPAGASVPAITVRALHVAAAPIFLAPNIITIKLLSSPRGKAEKLRPRATAPRRWKRYRYRWGTPSTSVAANLGSHVVPTRG